MSEGKKSVRIFFEKGLMNAWNFFVDKKQSVLVVAASFHDFLYFDQSDNINSPKNHEMWLICTNYIVLATVIPRIWEVNDMSKRIEDFYLYICK